MFSRLVAYMVPIAHLHDEIGNFFEVLCLNDGVCPHSLLANPAIHVRYYSIGHDSATDPINCWQHLDHHTAALA